MNTSDPTRVVNLESNEDVTTPDEPTTSEESSDENLDETDNPELSEEEPEFNFNLEQLPDDLTDEIRTHMNLFSRTGVEVVGLGRIEIEDNADFTDPEETDGDVGLDLSEVQMVEMFCTVSEVKFIYNFYPDQEYNGLQTQYSVLKDLLLISNVDALTSLDDRERASAVNGLEDILSPKDLGVILKYNRNIDRSELLSDLNIIRSQNSNMTQMIERTEDGEVAGIQLEQRVYIDEEDAVPQQERTLYNSVQSISNISRSYVGLLEAAYLENGIDVPDSIAEKINASVTQKEWDEFDRNEPDERLPGFQ